MELSQQDVLDIAYIKLMNRPVRDITEWDYAFYMNYKYLNNHQVYRTIYAHKPPINPELCFIVGPRDYLDTVPMSATKENP
jgi:hypothetical protein